MGAQMLYFDPLYLISIRILSGISLGVYWPNCYNLLSRWQSVSNDKKSNRNFKQFNFSWNLGFISGLLCGYLWALTLNEYITMTIALFLSFLLVPFSLFLKKDLDLNHLGEESVNIEQYNIELNSDVNLRKVPKQKSNNHMIVYPILFSWLTLFVYAISKSIIRFSYPVFLKSFGSPSYFAYLIQLSLQIGQLAGLTWGNSMKIYSRKVSVLTSLIMIVFSSFAIIITQNLLYISIISASIGLFIGLIQGASLKIMIDYGAERNTKKYSTINEVLKGIGFGLTPIFAGFVAEINIYAIFIFLVIFIFSVFIPIIYLSRNIKKRILINR
jgi:MFS family permease